MNQIRLIDEGIRDVAAIRELVDRLGSLHQEALVTSEASGSSYRATFDGVRHRRVALRVFDDAARDDLRPPTACRVDFELDTAWTFHSIASFNCAWNGAGALVIVEMPERVAPNESRASTRLDVTEFPLRIELIAGAEMFAARAVDVNQTGLGVEVLGEPGSIVQGTTLEAVVRYHEQLVRGEAVVRWQDGSRLGLHLVGLEEEAQRAWSGLVTGIQVEALMRRLGKAI